MDTNDKKHTNRRPSAAAARHTRPKKKADAKVVYTEAKPFNRNRFILQLVTMAAVVLALLLSTAIFFRTKYVLVSGAETYTAYQVKQASGIQDGENLLTISGAKVGGKIMIQLPYIKQVRVQLKLPDTVLIEVVEVDVTYAIQAKDEQWWLMDCSGKIVDSVSDAGAKSYTQILGVRLDTPAAGKQAVAEEPVPEGTTPDGETVPVTVYGSERLSTVLTILQNLEKRGVVGNVVSSVDVSNIGSIELQYGDRYRILLGDNEDLDRKIHMMKNTIDQSSTYQSGTLDLSFTTRPDEVIYTPS